MGVIEPAGDGWRYRVPCVQGCGQTAIVVLAHILDARCMDCGRALRRAPVPRRPAPGANNGYRMGQGGVACYPYRRCGSVATGDDRGRAVPRVLYGAWVEPGHPLVPASARRLAGEVSPVHDVRIRLSVARRDRGGQVDAWCGVQWVGGWCLWRNGSAAGGRVGSVKMSYTQVMAHLRGVAKR